MVSILLHLLLVIISQVLSIIDKFCCPVSQRLECSCIFCPVVHISLACIQVAVTAQAEPLTQLHEVVIDSWLLNQRAEGGYAVDGNMSLHSLCPIFA